MNKAEENFRRAAAIRGKLAPGSKEQSESLAALAETLPRTGKLGPAAQFYEQALNALEGQTAQMGAAEQVRAEFRARHEQYYRDYVMMANMAADVWFTARGAKSPKYLIVC